MGSAIPQNSQLETSVRGPSTALAAWGLQPRVAFAAWFAQRLLACPGEYRPFRATSVQTYSAIFNTWVTFLGKRYVAVPDATSVDVSAFFEEHVPPLDSVSRRRYLQLLEKVYQELRELGGPPSPVTLELAKEHTLATRFPVGLTRLDQGALLTQLTAREDWKAYRDRALVALLWGAGLRCNEAIALRWSDIGPSYRVALVPAGVHRAHQSLVLPGGPWRTWLDEWHLEKAKLKVPGTLVCPATLAGKQYSASGVYRRLDALFGLAGLSSAKSGANVLRNTFTHTCLESQMYSLAELKEFLGHEELRATRRHLLASPA